MYTGALDLKCPEIQTGNTAARRKPTADYFKELSVDILLVIHDCHTAPNGKITKAENSLHVPRPLSGEYKRIARAFKLMATQKLFKAV